MAPSSLVLAPELDFVTNWLLGTTKQEVWVIKGKVEIRKRPKPWWS